MQIFQNIYNHNVIKCTNYEDIILCKQPNARCKKFSRPLGLGFC